MVKVVVASQVDFVAVQTAEVVEGNTEEQLMSPITAIPLREWESYGHTIDHEAVLGVFFASDNKFWAALSQGDNDEIITEWHGPFENSDIAYGTILAVYSLETTILHERKIKRENEILAIDSRKEVV